MKRHLFYSFLFIFVATTIVTLFGVIGVIPIPEKYLDKLIWAFLGELAAAVISLFRKTDFFSSDLVVTKLEARDVNVVIETGEIPLSFRGDPYQAGAVAFSQKFSEPPKVFIGECAAGNWIFVKLDEKTNIGFRWAARPIENERLVYETKLQWIAVGKVNEEKPKV
jgi:hypothetical protein